MSTVVTIMAKEYQWAFVKVVAFSTENLPPYSPATLADNTRHGKKGLALGRPHLLNMHISF